MRIEDYYALETRAAAGQILPNEFLQLRDLARHEIKNGDDVSAWTAVFKLAFRYPALFAPIEAAKAMVDVALAADETLPVVCPYDTLIKEALSPAERSELFGYIALRIGDNRSPQSFSAAADLADYVTDIDLGLNY